MVRHHVLRYAGVPDVAAIECRLCCWRLIKQVRHCPAVRPLLDIDVVIGFGCVVDNDLHCCRVFELDRVCLGVREQQTARQRHFVGGLNKQIVDFLFHPLLLTVYHLLPLRCITLGSCAKLPPLGNAALGCAVGSGSGTSVFCCTGL